MTESSPSASGSAPCPEPRGRAIVDAVRAVVDRHGRLAVPMETLSDGHDLFEAGLTSFAAVRLMLAFEAEFGVAFADSMLTMRSFASVGSIARCLADLGVGHDAHPMPD